MKKILMNIWYYLFPPNDWELINHTYDECLVDQLIDGVFQYTSKKMRHYYIYYSKFRNKYELRIKGYEAEDSYLYSSLLNQVVELNKNLQNEKTTN